MPPPPPATAAPSPPTPSAYVHQYTYESADEALTAEPTKTLSIRRGYARELRGTLDQIRAAIRTAIVDEDVFGLESARTLARHRPASDALVEPPPTFDFPTDAEKERAFDTWLDNQLHNDILSEHRGGNAYLERAYERGLSDADRDVGRFTDVEVEDTPVEAVIRRPVHRDVLETVYTRNYRQLEGLTSQMGSDMSRVLAEGLSTGQNPRTMASDLADVIGSGGPSGTTGAQARATMIARTETQNAYHEAAFQRYADYDVDRVELELAAGACDRCVAIAADGPYRRSELRGMVPVHPQCRCATRPVQQ